MPVRYAYADTPLGQLHYAEGGSGSPLILLHQTPRSLDEFAELQPLLATKHRVIAMDMYGFGMSAKPPAPQTIEQYASGVFALADALGLERFAVLGHHTGMFVATEVCAAQPSRVTAAVYSSGAFGDAAFRAAESDPEVDAATIQDDGSHLTELWRFRLPNYPPGRPDLLNRFIRDALAPGIDPREGHLACARYIMEDRVGRVTAPVLMLAATEDPVAYHHTEPLRGAFPQAQAVEVHEIVGGRVCLIEDKAPEIAEVVGDFLQRFSA
ncbi:alpha/beta hydrolase [Streptomyces sp. ISID311]|uniref:alpha/beta fold hydrolase n=1 Tax=Streptomyces sp. ISID311 TaxID=2601673 RepID=UPI0011BD3FA5|nr:alpha/beta hydrolase [Streptomyces sp. ISID311]TXC99902.1 alpha/beta hydrolase [Streptomyces sp. ISID311]